MKFGRVEARSMLKRQDFAGPGLLLLWVSAFLSFFYVGAQTPPAANTSEVAVQCSIQEFLDRAPAWGESKRVVLTGVVTHSTSDKTFFIQQAGAATYVFNRPDKAFARGDVVEVTANPSLGGFAPTLQNCSVRLVGHGPIPAPIRLSEVAMNEVTNSMKLVTLQGRLEENRLGNGRTLIFRSEKSTNTFNVEAEALPDIEPLNKIPAHCLIDATGILTRRTGPNRQPADVRLLIPSAEDLVIVQGPPFWTTRRLQQAAFGCGAAFALVITWVLSLRREVQRQTALILQRFEREAALAASENRFLKVFTGAPDPMLIIRASDERVIDVNPAFERVTGYTKSEALGRTTRELCLWADDKFRDEVIAKLREGKPVINLQFQARGKTGETIWAMASTEVIEVDGDECWLSLVRDITKQKNAEERQRRVESMLAQSQKLESLGTMAGGIAHDFNNILAAIVSNSELAGADNTKPPGSPQFRLAEIQKAALRGRDLVKQILAFSRQQEPQQKHKVQLENTVTEAARLLRAVTPTTIQIETEIRANCPTVSADPGAILQVIVNLGLNGCQAMEKRPGKLTIGVGPAVVDSSLSKKNPNLIPGDYLCLTVTDEGEGMDSETIRRIFDPFFTTKAPGKGTGLGLAVAQRIVNEHGGVIFVDSAPNAGAKFSIFLTAVGPAMPGGAEAPKAIEEDPQSPRGKGEHILVVDDDSQLRMVTERILGSLGYRVTVTEEPGNALKAIQSNPAQFQLLLTDLNMPGMSGFELIDHVRKIDSTLPIILLSGFVTEDQRRTKSADAALRFMQKPATREEFASALAEALSPETQARD